LPTADEKKTAKAGADVQVGDQVHYVWPDGGHHHAAFVANVLDPARSYVTLSVLDHNGGFMQSPWVAFDAGGAPGTWHFKEDTAGGVAADDDRLDPAGLNIAEDGTTPVPQGLTAEVPGTRTDEQRAADARVPRTVLKDDPLGHRVADTAAATKSADTVDRTAITETAGEKVARADAAGTRRPSDPAARNVAAEPSVAAKDAQQADPDAPSSARTSRAREEAAAAGKDTTPTPADKAEARRATEKTAADNAADAKRADTT
jgi:hypothetical protein